MKMSYRQIHRRWKYGERQEWWLVLCAWLYVWVYICVCMCVCISVCYRSEFMCNEIMLMVAWVYAYQQCLQRPILPILKACCESIWLSSTQVGHDSSLNHSRGAVKMLWPVRPLPCLGKREVTPQPCLLTSTHGDTDMRTHMDTHHTWTHFHIAV